MRAYVSSERKTGGLRHCVALGTTITLLGTIASAQPAAEPRTNLWVPDGHVNQVVEAGGRLYFSGQFSNLVSGFNHGAVYDLASGARVAQLPEIVGRVAVVVSDGKDGWFIGGGFSSIGHEARGNLAHLNRDGQLDPGWRADTDGGVGALAVHGETLFVGGGFRSVAGQSRTNMAAVRIADGEPLDWKRNTTTLGGVISIAVADGVVLVQEARVARSLPLAAYDRATGKQSSWAPEVKGDFFDLCADESAVFVVGDFRSADGMRRDGAAAWDFKTGKLLAWDAKAGCSPLPNPYDPERTKMRRVWTDGRVVLAAGNFGYLAGQPHKGFGTLDAKTGQPWTWSPVFESPPESGEFANGKFYAIAGCRIYEVDFDAQRIRPLGEKLPPGTRDLGVSGSRVCLVGWYPNADAVASPGLAAVDLNTGRPTDWHPWAERSQPKPNIAPYHLLAVGRRLLAVWPEDQNRVVWRIAALSLEGAGPPAWVSSVKGHVYAMVPLREQVLVSTLSPKEKRVLHCLDASNGRMALWGPKFEGAGGAAVHGMAVVGNRVYLHGGFERVGNRSLTNLAALDAVTGDPLPWNPKMDGKVSCMVAHDGKLFVGGTFKRIAAQERPGLAVFDGTTGELTSWSPEVQWEELNYPMVKHVSGLSLHDKALLVAMRGRLDVGIPGRRVYAFNSTTGARLAWNPRLLPEVRGFMSQTVVRTGPTGVCVVGDFQLAGGRSCDGFVAFPWLGLDSAAPR